MTSSIEIINISKIYKSKNKDDVVAVKNVNLKAGSGDFIAVLGPSGCGKSTLMMLAGGLLEADSGNISVNGQELSVFNNSQRAEFRARNIAYVYQEFHLIPYLNVVDNIMITDLALGEGSRDKTLKLLSQFGLEGRGKHLPSELSVGEQQRVALARAIYGGARIILADEPTGNLDQGNAEVVLSALKSFTEDGGIVLMVTHDDRAINYASTKMTMKEGQWDVNDV